MESTTEQYLRLGLRLGRHVDGLVDAYYGPTALAAETDAEPLREPADLVADAEALVDELEDGWLLDQARGLRTYAGMLAGEELSWADEVEGSYGIRPRYESEETFAAAQARLDELLPPGGSLLERYEAWRAAETVPGDRVLPALAAVVERLRALTRERIGLPDGEDVDLETVSGEPWLAFNYYLGGLRSRVVANLDLPLPASDLAMLAPHETYPGHHTERVWKERLLVEGRGRLEESIVLVPTPQSLVSEGIAEIGAELLLDAADLEELAAILRNEGIECDLAHGTEVGKSREAFTRANVNAALMLHDGGASVEEVTDYLARWALRSPERAAKSVEFLSDPTWRAYTITYAEGGRLARAYVDGDDERFVRLLKEQVRVGELVAAAAGDTAVSSGP
jgi:hypothetical protein